jgi:DtxR family transcriptional regulator, Mn-dependent transcriptional regulator
MPVETHAEQDYLKQIYLLQEESGRATTQALADRLNIRPSSVTAMIKRLADDEDGAFVRHTPYHGVELTNRGIAVALEMLRHHRLIELFLSELLGVPWDRVHAEAERLEHVLSEDLEERIANRLGDPQFDPHGDPIPTREGIMPVRSLPRLTEMGPGTAGRIERIDQQEQEVLQYLASLGLVMHAPVTLVGIAPFGGVVTLRVGEPGCEETHALGGDLAMHILIEQGDVIAEAG